MACRQLRATQSISESLVSFMLIKLFGSTGTDGPSLNMHENDRIWRYDNTTIILCHGPDIGRPRAQAPAHTPRVRTYNIIIAAVLLLHTHARIV